MRQPKTVYIYGLKDPRDGQIYYVGKTDNLKNRYAAHLKDKKTNSERVAWIQDLAASELSPEMVVLQKSTISEWREDEIYWIALGCEEGWPLVNISSGGPNSIAQPNYDFMKSYIHPGLWNEFDGFSIRQKNEIVIKTAKAMADMHQPFLEEKIRRGQYAMHSLIDDGLVSIGMQIATGAVNGILGA